MTSPIFNQDDSPALVSNLDTGPQPARYSSSTTSQQVSWWETHEFIKSVLDQANSGPLPPAGTPAWCELSAGDPRKLLALAVAGEHHVLRVETVQAVRAQASRAISASADWSEVARGIRRRSSVYIPRRSA